MVVEVADVAVVDVVEVFVVVLGGVHPGSVHTGLIDPWPLPVAIRTIPPIMMPPPTKYNPLWLVQLTASLIPAARPCGKAPAFEFSLAHAVPDKTSDVATTSGANLPHIFKIPPKLATLVTELAHVSR